ncbi:MAG: TetR/AcrR family transcriptional regulator [Flammeovirgaceae bacterium]
MRNKSESTIRSFTQQSEKGEEVKERILVAAGEFFQKFGIKSVTMEDIAKNLGISKKTIYLFFKDKDDLVEHVAIRQMEMDVVHLKKIENESQNIIEHLIKISEFIRQRLTELNPAMIYDLRKYHPKAWKLFADHREHCQESLVISTLEQGIKEGYFRNNLDVKALSRMRLLQIEMAFDPNIFPPAEFNLLKIQMQFFEHFLYGLCTEKGFEMLRKIHQKLAIND